MRRGMVGSFNGFGRFGSEGGSRGDGAAQSIRNPWARRSRPEASWRQLCRPKVAAVAARRR
jgi:hypothetical protein